MQVRQVLGVLTIITAFATVPAFAQDAGKTGIAMAYPAAFGLVWHATENVAIRPSVTFGGSSTDSSPSAVSSSNWNVGATVAALFYLKKLDSVRTYVSPSYRYARTKTTIHPPTSSTSPLGDTKSTGNTNGAAGTFGAEFTPNAHFRIIGEIGFAVTHLSASTSPLSGISTSGNSWGTTAGVGIVFYP